MLPVVYSRKRQRALERREQSSSSYLGKIEGDDAALSDKVSANERHQNDARNQLLTTCSKKARRKNSWLQLCIDAGQADISQRTCNVCGMVFTPGVPDDMTLHRSYHSRAVANKDRPPQLFLPDVGRYRVVVDANTSWAREMSTLFRTGDRIIAITSSDTRDQIRTVSHVDSFIASMLNGCAADSRFAVRHVSPSSLDPKIETARNCEQAEWLALMYISSDSNDVRGYVLAELVSQASLVQISCEGLPVYHGLSERLNSDGLRTPVCGISKVWVHPEFRRKKIALVMLHCARFHVTHPLQIPVSRVAFTPPTQAGAELALAFAHDHKQPKYPGSRVIPVYRPQIYAIEPRVCSDKAE